MSRLRNFSRNLVSSYLQLGANVVYSLVSVPIILHWLPTAEFGLWALLMQIVSYLMLVDLGMTSAAARFLVDHKDDRENATYGSLITTAVFVSACQGAIILCIIYAGSPLLASLAKVPAAYDGTFISLLRWQGTIVAFHFCSRPLALILYAHQRADITAYSEMGAQCLSLVLLCLFLSAGLGIYSFVYANAVAGLLIPAYLLANCHALGFLPAPGKWGRSSWTHFVGLFRFGRDVFLMNLGAQLITASQTIIVSRTLGLAAAAAWAVGTKMFTLITLLTCRPYGAAIPGMFEMLARGETARLRSRFMGMVVLTASLGVLLGVLFALCNSTFVQVWTHSRIHWLPLYDVLLGVWIVFSALQTTHSNFVSVTKQIGGMRYMYFLEGCCFVLAATAIGSRWGFAGIITASIISTVLFSYQYGIRRSAKYFTADTIEIALHWILPTLKLAVILIPFAIILYFATNRLPPIVRLFFNSTIGTVVGSIVFLRFGIPLQMCHEMSDMLPSRVGRIVRSLTPCHG